MEYIQAVLFQIPAAKIDEAARLQGLLAELDEHRKFLHLQRGFQDMRIIRSINVEGDVQLVVETRWQDDDSLVDYETREPNVMSIVSKYQGLIVPGSLQVADMEAVRPQARGEPALAAAEVRERIALPLLVPMGILAFALLVIYGLSRIYLEVPTEVATGLAAGIAAGILGVSWFLATQRRIGGWQIASIVAVAVALLLGGGIFAAVHEEGEAETGPPAEQVTPGPAEAALAEGGALAVSLVEFAVNPGQGAVAADTVTLTITNDGAIVHNFLLIRTDLAPDALPKDGPQVDETAVDVVVATELLVPGQTEQASVELDPGSYVLICNVPGHYDLGMRAALTVEQGSP